MAKKKNKNKGKQKQGQSGNPAKREQQAKPQQNKKKQDGGFVEAVVRGVPIKVDADALDDWELIETLAAFNSDDPHAVFALPDTLRRMLGEDTYERVKDALRNEGGKVTAAAMGEFFTEMMKALDPNS